MKEKINKPSLAKVLRQIRMDKKERFTATYMCEEDGWKVNWTGMTLPTFRRRVDKGQINSYEETSGKTNKPTYWIEKEDAIKWVEKYYENN